MDLKCHPFCSPLPLPPASWKGPFPSPFSVEHALQRLPTWIPSSGLPRRQAVTHLDSWWCLTRGGDISFQTTSNQPWVLSLCFHQGWCQSVAHNSGDRGWYSFFGIHSFFQLTGDLNITAVSLMGPSKVWVLCGLLIASSCCCKAVRNSFN